ncbi:MAG: hypothetical protein HY664_07690 [Chloroflexi bacterium]|nr:hypothetical protein [Chloroflexota bacterium]
MGAMGVAVGSTGVGVGLGSGVELGRGVAVGVGGNGVGVSVGSEVAVGIGVAVSVAVGVGVASRVAFDLAQPAAANARRATRTMNFFKASSFPKKPNSSFELKQIEPAIMFAGFLSIFLLLSLAYQRN